MKKKGNINVQTENIFPIIKQFLYSDNEIFLRELVSNAVDATQKLKTLKSVGELSTDLSKLRVEVILDKDKKTITIRDNGIGMTGEEVEKYINQIAFSGAEEFVNKYKDKDSKNSIIGHFGLGFYSSFMVSDNVEILTKSQIPNSKAVKWSCDGSPNYNMEEISKKTKGTDVVLHISEDSTEFLEESRLTTILNKYCKFLPVEIKFGQKSEFIDDPKGKKDKDGNVEKIEKKVDNIINNTKPAWTKRPSNLKESHYKEFYKELYPMEFNDPLFHIHLNVDFPFNLTGILYFPKLKNNLEVQKNKINLYSNQVFITDNVENIVPDFLTLLHGVIDSPDIPLNVSRSYLQADSNVKKISGHISKKVADKLNSMFKKDRGYDVLELSGPLVSHLISKIESKETNVQFARVDSDTIDKLIDKGDNNKSKLTDKEIEKLKKLFEDTVEKPKFTVQVENLSVKDDPIIITQSEFMRRMKEQQMVGGGGMQMFGDMPESFNLVVNSNHDIIHKIATEKTKKKKTDILNQVLDLALLSKGMLKGKELTDFIKRSVKLID